MKKIMLLIAMIISTLSEAQTFNEWFRQKATQRKYLLQQIAALQVQLGYVKKGYAIYQKGLNTIGNIKNGEFRLHKGYFDSLKMVSPAIAHYGKVAAIIRLEEQVMSCYHTDYNALRQSAVLHTEELNYCYRVYSRLTEDCTEVLEELTHITTDGELQMSDDERMQRIDALYEQMRSNYGFVQGFGSRAKLLARSRKQQQNDINTSRLLNGIKNE